MIPATFPFIDEETDFTEELSNLLKHTQLLSDRWRFEPRWSSLRVHTNDPGAMLIKSFLC